jgi:hypothetical protein
MSEPMNDGHGRDRTSLPEVMDQDGYQVKTDISASHPGGHIETEKPKHARTRRYHQPREAPDPGG